jgi:hypothetical protein
MGGWRRCRPLPALAVPPVMRGPFLGFVFPGDELLVLCDVDAHGWLFLSRCFYVDTVGCCVDAEQLRSALV